MLQITSDEAFRFLKYAMVVLVLVTAWAIYNRKYGKQLKVAWIVYAILCFVAGML